eukprot:Rmarinus@m.9342
MDSQDCRRAKIHDFVASLLRRVVTSGIRGHSGVGQPAPGPRQPDTKAYFDLLFFSQKLRYCQSGTLEWRNTIDECVIDDHFRGLVDKAETNVEPVVSFYDTMNEAGVAPSARSLLSFCELLVRNERYCTVIKVYESMLALGKQMSPDLIKVVLHSCVMCGSVDLAIMLLNSRKNTTEEVVDILDNIISVCVAEGRYAEGIALYEDRKERVPGWPGADTLLIMAKLCCLTGKLELARSIQRDIQGSWSDSENVSVLSELLPVFLVHGCEMETMKIFSTIKCNKDMWVEEFRSRIFFMSCHYCTHHPLFSVLSMLRNEISLTTEHRMALIKAYQYQGRWSMAKLEFTELVVTSAATSLQEIVTLAGELALASQDKAFLSELLPENLRDSPEVGVRVQTLMFEYCITVGDIHGALEAATRVDDDLLFENKSLCSRFLRIIASETDPLLCSRGLDAIARIIDTDADTNVDMLMQLLSCCVASNRLEQGQRYAERLRQITRSVEPQLLLVQLYLRSSLPDEAAIILDKVISAETQLPSVNVLRVLSEIISGGYLEVLQRMHSDWEEYIFRYGNQPLLSHLVLCFDQHTMEEKVVLLYDRMTASKMQVNETVLQAVVYNLVKLGDIDRAVGLATQAGIPLVQLLQSAYQASDPTAPLGIMKRMFCVDASVPEEFILLYFGKLVAGGTQDQLVQLVQLLDCCEHPVLFRLYHMLPPSRPYPGSEEDSGFDKLRDLRALLEKYTCRPSTLQEESAPDPCEQSEGLAVFTPKKKRRLLALKKVVPAVS